MKSSRDNWGSKLGVILAVAGSAVGLGNFLRFPVQAATNGGGAFIIPYLIAFLLLGIPLSWMEWTLGRAAGNKHHGTAPGGFHYILNKKPWAKHLGSLGLLPPLFISFYYIFIQSWILAFTLLCHRQTDGSGRRRLRAHEGILRQLHYAEHQDWPDSCRYSLLLAHLRLQHGAPVLRRAQGH